eukprot:symbB.v1.2.017899.t1/scaffold1407.1/size120637/3
MFWTWKPTGGDVASSDDGEPAGTAGMPMRAILEGSNLFGAIVLVTRYFGGIKLGTGGLVRAYSAATRAVLEEAQMEEMVEGRRLLVKYVPAAQVSSLYRGPAQLLGEPTFSEDGTAQAELWVPKKSLEDVKNELRALHHQVELHDLKLEDLKEAHEVEDEEEEEIEEDELENSAMEDVIELEQWNELLETSPSAEEAVDLADLAIEAQGWTATKNGGFWCAIGRKISSSSEVILKLSKFSG